MSELAALRSNLEHLAKQNSLLAEDNERLREENRLLKLQIEEFEQKFYKKNVGKPENDDLPPPPPRKRGAPNGHPGKTRHMPDHFDEHQDVKLSQCPDCGGHNLSACRRHEDHYQEDIILPQVKVTRFRHHFYWCRNCHKVVYGTGDGELPGSYIGPVAKSLASFLHYQMKLWPPA